MLELDQQTSTPWSVSFIWLIIPSFSQADNFLDFSLTFHPKAGVMV